MLGLDYSLTTLSLIRQSAVLLLHVLQRAEIYLLSKETILLSRISFTLTLAIKYRFVLQKKKSKPLSHQNYLAGFGFAFSILKMSWVFFLCAEGMWSCSGRVGALAWGHVSVHCTSWC